MARHDATLWNNCKIHFTIVDCLVIIIFLCLFASSSFNAGLDSPSFFRCIKWMCLFFMLRIALSVYSKYIQILLLFIVSSLFVSELFVGLKQAISGTYSEIPGLICCGSFLNSGPYGGFMAVCLSLLLAYLLFSDKITNRYRWLILILFLPAVVILFLSLSRAAIISFLISAFLLFLCLNEKMVRRYIFLLIPSFLLFSILLYFFKKPSADARFYISKINMEIIAKNPFWGSGNNSFGRMYGESQKNHFINGLLESESKESFNDDSSCTEIVRKLIIGDFSFQGSLEKERRSADVPDVAFNEYIQIAIEYGLLTSLVCVSLILISIIRLFKSKSPWAYALCSLAFFSLFSYPLSYIYFKILLLVSIASAAVCQKDSYNDKSIISYAVFIVSLSLLIYVCPKSNTDLAAKKKWQSEIKKYYWIGDYEKYVLECKNLFDYLSEDQEFLYTYGNALHKTGNLNNSDYVLTIGALTSNHPRFETALGWIKREIGEDAMAEEYFCEAYLKVPNRLYPLYSLARLYFETDNYLLFEKIVEYIEKYPPKCENDDTRKMRKEIEKLTNNINDSSL